MKRFQFTAAALICALACPTAVNATIYNWVFPIDGGQEVPPVDTTGFGTGDVTYNDVSNELSWHITFQDLIGDYTVSHFHGPAAIGDPAGIQVDIPGTGSPLVGGPVIISDAQEVQLLGGLWYVNIHSSFRTGGEIRGQVVPEPATLLLLCVGSAMIIRNRWARRQPA